ncbi:MAG: thiamine biosynthesis protein ThiF [Bacteroidia bacterium]|nr:MAG: thiamine biosynthesis protein ThiF [Bacteroidia bacterium]
MITPEEFKYYQRQIILENFGLQHQEKIKNTSLLIVGAGGLGCPLLQMCSGIGFGKIGIVDFDTVSLHNLHRQYLYTFDEINHSKSKIAREKISSRNPFIEIVEYPILLDESNIESILQNYDIITDGTDNFNTRYLINDTCVKLNKPLVFGSIFKWTSQVALLNFKGSKHLRDIFPEPPSPEEAPSCAEAGVVNTVTTHCASLMAQLIVFATIGKGHEWSNKIILSDLWNMKQTIISF